jgi:Plasmid encoded RepA protein
MNLLPHTLRDPDLIQELAAYDAGHRFGKPGMRSLYVAELEERQKQLDARALALEALPPVQRRRLQTANDLASDAPSLSDLRHMHSVLAICGTPYDRLPIAQREFKRVQGNMSVTIEAGSLDNPDGSTQPQPIPFGPKARLLMMHLCSEAVRQKSPKIEIADTLTGFVRDMGFPDSGGKKGPLTAFKEQINALAAARIRVSAWTEGNQRTRFIQPFDEIDIWLPKNPDQRMLWPSTITLSDSFFRSLEQHAMPVNVKAVRAFASSARKLDLLFWIGYRLHNIKKPLPIGWDALAVQWGQGYGRHRDFERKFAIEIEQIKEVFPKLPLVFNDQGIVISPAGPEVLGLPQLRRLKTRSS